MGRAFAMAGVCALGAFVAQACMSRPLVSTEPHTSNLYVEPIHTEVVDKIDLLFMIDNSSSMGDKQQLLAKAVPQLVDRLVVPRCVGPAGEIKKRSSATEACPSGYVEEFRAVKDIHIGVITSSLGAHGAANPIGGCGGGAPANDRALLLPKARPSLGLSSYADTGFLAWDPNQKLTPPGSKDSTQLGRDFGALVSAADQQGCGYEASLESWYRFLIDPEPPQSVRVVNERAVPGPPDQELLAQRAAFLRPDSLVAIVMLTDENDCSIRDDQFGYYLAEKEPYLPRATSACDKDPNDRCCFACNIKGQAPEGCPAPDADVACQKGKALGPDQTPANLRCLQNKRRFGYDFLYPTSRYIDGLTQLQIPRRSDGALVENPLFAKVPGKPRRDKRLVYLAGIVGVPWQDIADESSLHGAGLRYLTARELSDAKRWDVIVGDPANDQPPSDPFMLEQTQPRTGQNPITGISIAPATSLDPQANPINGHEQVDIDGTDLQYACTFKLPEPLPCDKSTGSCDCQVSNSPTDGGDGPRNRPLCQAPGGGAASSTQYYGKAYPGLRPLEVLRGIGDSAIVASICPKVLDSNQPGYGYEPAVDRIVDSLRGVLVGGRCPPRPLAVKADDGKLPCVVVEASQADGACACSDPSRSPASAEAEKLVLEKLKGTGECGLPGTPACDSAAFCMCELAQSEGEALQSCLNDVAGPNVPGYCYVDPYGPEPVGNPALVAQCDPTSRRLIRFVGPDTPKPHATTFIACLGATVH